MTLRCLFGFHDLPYVEWLHTGTKWVTCRRCGRTIRNPN